MLQPQIKAYVCLSVPFLRRNPKFRTLDGMRAAYGEDYYICRFQEPGKMEAQIAEAGIGYVLKNILTTRQTGPPILPKGKYGIGFNPDAPETLPSWLTEEDLAYYVSKFEKTGFTGGLNYYRNLNLNWELSAPWTGAKIKTKVVLCINCTDGLGRFVCHISGSPWPTQTNVVRLRINHKRLYFIIHAKLYVDGKIDEIN
ncbi:unnamed protein product [Vicia faba]|uniref:Uncharacterized protein n=1 Tax=Vicia faba TaxID=3906 RepID=A0AAV1B1S2_VICFA|nr:unnamed protein product [Vicia faba]